MIEQYLITQLRIAIGQLLNGNVQQAINILEDVIAYLEDYSNK